MRKYPKYKESGVGWIGEIPIDFKIIRLKFLCSVTTGGKDTQNKVDDGLYPFYVRSPHIERINSYSFDGESVLTVGDGVGTGKVFHYVTGKFDFHQRVYKFSHFKNILGKYFFWFIRTKFINVSEDQNSKSTVDSLRLPMIQNFLFVIPSLPEQKQIVNFLDQKTSIIDELVQKKQQKIELLKEHRTSIINHTVTKGLNSNVKMKDSGVEWIGKIPEQWIVKKMKYFVKICNGSDYKDFVLEEGGYPVYGTGGVFSRCSKFLYDKTSVLLGRKGSVDKPQIVFEPFWTSDTTYYTEIKDNVSPEYFFHLVNQIHFDRYIYGSTIPSMTKSVYDDMLFPYPTLSEQQEIVQYLKEKTSEIDTQISLENKKIDLLKEFRQSLISEVVTGKIDVRQN
jgi:type I restriction enzyme S subunit